MHSFKGDLPYEPELSCRDGKYCFQPWSLSEDQYMDIKMRGSGMEGERVELCVKDPDGRVVYENQIRMSREMGVYGIQINNSISEGSELEIEVSDKVAVVEVVIRAEDDICGLSRYFTNISDDNRQFTKAFSEGMGRLLTWFVTWQCNYRCPYCWERLEEEKYRGLGKSSIDISPEEWADAINRVKPRELYITGGEPSLYRGLPRVIDRLNDSIALRMTTNFGQSFDLSAYEQAIRNGRFRHITASFHPSEVGTEFFYEKVRRAKNMGIVENCGFSIEMVLFPDDLSKAEDLLAFCEAEDIDVSPDIYNDPKSRHRPDEAEKKRVRDLIDRARRIKDKRKLVRDKWSIGERLIVICGAGTNGRSAMHAILQDHKDKVCCISDSRAIEGQCYCGIPIYTYSVATSLFPDADYLITVGNRQSMVDIAAELTLKGVPVEHIHVLTGKKANRSRSVRGKAPIWCPAGMLTMHMDPEGQLYTCMLGISNKKLFGKDTMPIYKPIGSIFDDNVQFSKEPVACWESYRCSACDYEYLEAGMTELILSDKSIYLPLPE